MAQSPFLILVNIPPRDWSYPLLEQRQVIGRAPGVEIPVPKRFNRVSRRHAEVWSDKLGLWIQDLNSRKGTQINGVPIEKLWPTQIFLKDRLSLGGMELEVVSMVSRKAAPPQTAAVDEEDRIGDTTTERQTTPLAAQLLLERLSPAELEVVLCLGRGHIRDEEIGGQLHRSPHTIRTQMNSIYRKLGVHSRDGVLNWFKRANGEA